MMLDVNIYTLLVGVVTFFLALYLLSWSRQPRNMPPGPAGWPLYGNILDIKRSDAKGPGIFDKWAKEFGDIYSVNLGQYPAVVLNSLEVLKEAFQQNGSNTSGRATKLFFIKYIARMGKSGIVLNEGEGWKTARRDTLHALRDFGMGKRSLEQKIQEEASALVSYLDDIGANGPVNPRQILHNTFTNVIVSIICGDRYDYGNPEFVHFSEQLSILIRGGGFQNHWIFVPLLTPMIFLSWDEASKLRHACNNLDAFLTKTIRNNRERFDPDDIRSFIDIYLKAEMNSEQNDKTIEQKLFYTLLDLFVAGSETATTTTRWAMLYLIHHPDVQTKCQQTIKEVIGQERIPTGSDRDKLVYVDATIHELQRMANIAAYSVLHRVEETIELSGYTIPKDTLIVPNLYHVHMDPRYWDAPERFNPDRWIAPDGSLLKHEAFVPFGLGPRECLGKTLAQQEIFIVLVSLLQKFTFTAVDHEHPPAIAGDIGSVYSPHDFNIILTRW